MHRVGSSSNTSGSNRSRKEKRLTYVLNGADVGKHCSGINCLALLKSDIDPDNFLFTGSRDGTIKRWAHAGDNATCSATFESHVDWVNDVVLVGGSTLVSCSSDTTLRTWDCLSDGVCTRTLRHHADYVTCLATGDRNSNIVASAGLGGEVFIWDIDSALAPLSKSSDPVEDDSSSNGVAACVSLLPTASLRSVGSCGNCISLHSSQPRGYVPVAAKGHKESVYALAMNETGTLLVSGGTEKVVRVWDPRSGQKTMKLRGHTDNIRSLLIDSTGRFCLSGSSDSMIRLWDLGMQRCIHSYAVHTDSVWALTTTPAFSHVYSGGRDLSLYLTDLTTRESVLLCTENYPVLQLALQADGIWVATTDASVHKWPIETDNPQKILCKGEPFLAGNLSFSRARISLEGCVQSPLYKAPSCVITGTPAIVQHEILNNKRHVLAKDTEGSVKLWEITRGRVIEDYGKVSFEEKKQELFEMVSIPAWFTVDTRLGSLSVHLETPQCFVAEMYSADINIPSKPEDDKVNLGRETLKGLFAQWLTRRRQKTEGDSNGVDTDNAVYAPFEFSLVSPPSIITEGSSSGGLWRKKITDLDGTEDEKDLPWWSLDCLLHARLPPRENTKCSFYLHPHGGAASQILTQGKLSAPRILRVHKVVNYVVEKMVLDKSVDGAVGLEAGPFSSPPGLNAAVQQFSVSSEPSLRPWQKLRPSIEILCNNHVLSPEMSLATVRAYVWKKPDDLVLNYRLAQSK